MTNQQHNTTQNNNNNYCWICSFVIRNGNILPICSQATSWDPNVDFSEDDMMGSQCRKKLSYASKILTRHEFLSVRFGLIINELT